MNAKRWAAHAALMATLVAGLTACGGGGDGAATETKAPEEQLTAGLTIRENTASLPENITFAIKALTTPVDTLSPTQSVYVASNVDDAAQDNKELELYVIYDSASNSVVKAVILRYPPAGAPWVGFGCGVSGALSCSNIVINPVTKEIRASSVVFKELVFSDSLGSEDIITAVDTVYAANGASLKASGSLTP